MKYITKPRVYWSDDLKAEINYPTQMTVIEQGDEFEETGLVDANGNDLFKIKPSVGFIHH